MLLKLPSAEKRGGTVALVPVEKKRMYTFNQQSTSTHEPAHAELSTKMTDKP
jgi:hypothetical protein